MNIGAVPLQEHSLHADSRTDRSFDYPKSDIIGFERDQRIAFLISLFTSLAARYENVFLFRVPDDPPATLIRR